MIVLLNHYHFIKIFNLVKHLNAKYGLRVTTTEVQIFQKAVLVGYEISTYEVPKEINSFAF